MVELRWNCTWRVSLVYLSVFKTLHERPSASLCLFGGRMLRATRRRPVHKLMLGSKEERMHPQVPQWPGRRRAALDAVLIAPVATSTAAAGVVVDRG